MAKDRALPAYMPRRYEHFEQQLEVPVMLLSLLKLHFSQAVEREHYVIEEYIDISELLAQREFRRWSGQ